MRQIYELWPAVQELAGRIVTQFGVAGLAIGVVQGEQDYAEGFGVRSVATGEAVTGDSLFHTASVSKTFVSAAVMALAEAGKVDLDGVVVDYVPEFRLADERYREITVRHMLNHTSGMPDTLDYGWERPEYDDEALERYVRSLANEKLQAAPGTAYAYSNIAYEVLGRLVAAVSGETFEGYVKRRLLEPLEMETSTFLRTEVLPEEGTNPHLRLPRLVVSPVYPYNRAHAPSSTLHSSAWEMCRWARLHLERGNYHGRRVLRPESYTALWQPYLQSGGSQYPDEHIGLGWFLERHRGRKVVFHTGGDVGFRSSLVLLPEEALGVILLANTYPAPVFQFTETILDLLLGYEPNALKPPVTTALAESLAEEGVEATVAVVRGLMARQPEGYDYGPEPFHELAYALQELERYPEARALLEVGLALHPDEETLGDLLKKVEEDERQNLTTDD